MNANVFSLLISFSVIIKNFFFIITGIVRFGSQLWHQVISVSSGPNPGPITTDLIFFIL